MLFIFDWDGTLVDSTGKIIRCMHAAVSDMGLEKRSDQQVREIIGLGLPEAIQILFPGIDSCDSAALSRCYSAHFIEADKTPCGFFPEVLMVMDRLKEEGHKLAVATGKSRRGLDRVLSNLRMECFFDASRCADETKSKPHPLMLQQLLKELRVERSDAVMIGDTSFDLEMAANAGIESIAVSYGAHTKERLCRHEPQLFMDSFQQLLEWPRLSGV